MIIPHPIFGDRFESIPVLPWAETQALMEAPAIREKIGTIHDLVDIEVVLIKNRLEEWPKQMPVMQLVGSLKMLRDAIEDNIIKGDERTRLAFCDVYVHVTKEMSLLEAYQLEQDLWRAVDTVLDRTLDSLSAMTCVYDASDVNTRKVDAWDVVLECYGKNKIGIIKIVREITGMGLKETKELVERAPVAIVKGVEKSDAEKFMAYLKEGSAVVRIRQSDSF